MGIDVRVALSGSSSKIHAHLGFLQGLEGMDASIREYDASSGGALIAALHAVGIPLTEIAEKLNAAKLEEYGAFGWRDYVRAIFFGYMARGGSKKLRATLEKYIGDLRMKDLPVPVNIMVSNMTNGRLVVVSPRTHPEMLVTDAVYMSASVPALFRPHIREEDDTMYRDGGIYKDFPIDIHNEQDTPKVGHLITSEWRPSVKQKTWTIFHELSLLLTRLVDANVDCSLKCVEHEDMVLYQTTDSHGIHTLDFKLKDEQKEDLRQGGVASGQQVIYDLLERLDPGAFKIVRRH